MKQLTKHILLSLSVSAFLFTAASASGAEIKDRTIKFSYVLPKEHPYGVGAAKFAQLVEQKSGGKMKVKTYSDGTLGSEVHTISATQGGVQEMTLVSSAPLVGIAKEFAIYDFPFLFSDEKEADAVLDGPVGKKLLDGLSEKNLIGLCYWENGFRNVTNSKRPIGKSEDLQGLKIRTMQNPVYTDVFNTLGANAVPMAMTEVYSALETRAIDAQENPYAIIHASKFNEVQKYVSATKHAYAPAPVLVSKRFWDKLTPDEQKVLQDSCVEARDYQRKVSREQTAKALAELKAKGMAFNEIPPEEIAKMREKVKPVIDKYTKEVGEDLVKQAYAEIEKVRKQK
jgi:tripartite ATP-independent transporter DctP family solute receptor